jgi:nucleoside-diphosphate-sugar epimerase/intein/homing endonuclease
MHTFITGGAGFIGCNMASRALGRGDRVTLYDNLSRPRTPHNLEWLQGQARADSSLTFVQGDVRDADRLQQALSVAQPDLLVHLASQVAVTTSVLNPREDFEINALGTFNVLEAARAQARPPAVFFASTNKVYGGMEDVAVVEDATRYRYRDLPAGVSEQQPLDFHSPYGCCYSADTDILTRTGWKKFPDLADDDEVLTYSMERAVSEFQKPVAHFAYPYNGKMYVQHNRRLKTCVTPNHKMLVSWDRTPCELLNPKLLEAEAIAGKPMAYLLGADYTGGEEQEFFTLPTVKAGKHKHQFEDKLIPMQHWLRFLGWYLSEGHCYEASATGNCTVTLTTYYRTEEAISVMRAIGLSPVVDQHHVVATSRQLYEYLKSFGHSHDKYIPPEIKALSGRYLRILLTALLDGDGNRQSKNTYRYTTVSPRLADNVQEIALKCGMAASVTRDPEGFYRVYIGTSRTAMCNLGGNRSEWVDYEGMVYCVEVPNSVVMVRQGGYAYFSGNSKGAGDQYVHDYARIYGLRTVVFRQSCLAASQTLVTPFGNKAIADVLPGELVHSGQGWATVRHVWRTGQKPVRRVSTMNGLQVTLTADHRLFRPHGLFSSRELAYGDFVAVLPEARHTPAWDPVADRVLDPAAYVAAVQARTTDARCINQACGIAEIMLPLTGDKLLAVAEVVGRLFGNGHLGIHTRQSRVEPAYNVQHFGTRAELEELSERLQWLGLSASAIIESEAHSELPSGQVIDGHTCRIQQQNIPIFTLFELLGVPVGDKVRTAYAMPAWVAQGSRLVKRAFLRGFFGAELCQPQPGSQNAPSFAQSKDVEYLENGRTWMQQLRDLLAEFGIQTSAFETEPVEYKRGTTVQMTVRLLGGQELYPCLAAIGYAFSTPRSQRLNALLRWQWTHTPAEYMGRVEQIYHADGWLFWDSVQCVEEAGEEPVFDLEIETDRHLVIAGGIQVSNCIYGERQFGVEDQGWVAHFVIAAVTGRPISIYGNGKQVRDLLHVQDLLNAYDAAWQKLDVASGQVFNVGGGMPNTLAIWTEFGPLLAQLAGRDIPVKYGDWRPGDQPVFVSDNGKARRVLGWEPQVSVQEGIRRLWNWVTANPELFR